MKDFNFYTPTRVVFGRESEEKVASLVKSFGGSRVLVHYGGGSARKSGLLDKMVSLLNEAGIYT
ncbi:MAG: iron-containing alcohol dehydrogenase, partial [Bacteroidales bacterium]|nr:iron-containing alcohol dehydrogenase [Candidatus Sodaliphilus fimicaballi]